MTLLTLIHGNHHCFKNGTTYLKNSAREAPDGYPLSGRGYLQRYRFNEDQVRYDANEIHIKQKSKVKGLREKGMAVLDNYSNTSILSHNNKLYTLFETKCAVEIEPETLTAISETDFGQPLCNYLNVHGTHDSDGVYWTFSHLAMHLVIHGIYESQVVESIHIPLKGMYYIHDMIVLDDYIIFPAFPSSVDVVGAVFDTIVDSISFNSDENLFLFIYDRESKQTTKVSMPNINAAVFHANGFKLNKNVIRLNLFLMKSGFQLADIKTKYDFNSQCITLDIKETKTLDDKTHFECIGLKIHSQIGDMPILDEGTQTMAYVSKDTLSIVDYQLCLQTRKFRNSILEEPIFVAEEGGTLRIVLLVHDSINNVTRMHIICPISLKSLSIYALPFKAPNGFHGTLT